MLPKNYDAVIHNIANGGPRPSVELRLEDEPLGRLADSRRFAIRVQKVYFKSDSIGGGVQRRVVARHDPYTARNATRLTSQCRAATIRGGLPLWTMGARPALEPVCGKRRRWSSN